MPKVSAEVFSFNDSIHALMLIILKLSLFFKILRKDTLFLIECGYFPLRVDRI